MFPHVSRAFRGRSPRLGATHSHAGATPALVTRCAGAAALALLAWLAVPARAGAPAAFEAGAGLEIARAAATIWAEDATLIYVENDEAPEAGDARRWGYLFHSDALGKSRGYSVRNGKIVAAETLEMKFDAPPLASRWIDSREAYAAAEAGGGRAFCRDHGGALSTMLLVRGAFADDAPDQTTWTLIYTSPGSPSLFVMVDAERGGVRRTWSG